jgi:hypothetical protein
VILPEAGIVDPLVVPAPLENARCPKVERRIDAARFFADRAAEKA